MKSVTLLAMSAAIVTASCGGASSSSDGQPVTLGSLSFEVPLDWKRTDSTAAGSLTSVWTPEPSANERKESVTVIRSELPAPRGKPAAPMLGRLLAGAQGTLRGARVSPVTSITTAQGLTAASIDLTFQPGTGAQRYRRTHVILVDADASALVHVLYTAATPDDGMAALQLVLGTIHREEG